MGLPSICLIVRTQGRFPDPEAARERLAQQLQGAGDESSQAQPIRGFQ